MASSKKLRRQLCRWRRFGGIMFCGLLALAAGCQRHPQTAAELAQALPHAFTGELHLQGETETRQIRLEPRELSVRSEHVLEFDRVAYQVQAGPDAPGAVGEARIRGTITAPGLAIRLETIGSDVAGGEDAIRPETFNGKLGRDLQTLDADWSTGFGQKVRLSMQAAPR